jgi:hypothetical protein
MVLLVDGCGPTRLYDGPALERDRVATIFAAPPDDEVHATALAIDGRAVRGGPVELLPGKHRVDARLHIKQASSAEVVELVGRCELEFEAAAGRRYQLAGVLGKGCQAWVRPYGRTTPLASCSCLDDMEAYERAAGRAGFALTFQFPRWPR